VVTFAVIIVLVISGLVLGSKNYLEQRGEINRQRQLNEKMLESQQDWLSAGWTGVIESKKPYVLTTIDNGIDSVDLTFVVKIILSLFVILLTYDAISGEKELGTLKVALANSVPRYKILLGKIIGGFSVIVLAFLLPLLIGLAFMMGFFPQVLGDFTPDTWWRLLIIIAVYLLYLAVFFSVGLFVSAFSQRSSTSFIVLLVVWVLFVTIVPRVSLASAERLRPYESYTTLQTKAFKEIAEKRAAVIKEVIPRITAIQQKLAMAEISGQALEPSTEFSEIRTEIWERLNKIRRRR